MLRADTVFRPADLSRKLQELLTVYGILRSGLERAMHEDEPPPFLGSWPRVYAAVLAYLAILILTLYAVTRFLTY
jgi:hypothetical protein